MSALYKKTKLIDDMLGVKNSILYRVHYDELTEEQGEQLLDTLIVTFNRELLNITKTDCAK